MSNEIKNFDRTIEHMMNESAVAPPFGMWNRISADLDAAEAVAATSAGTTPAPKRAIGGLLIGAMVIGASLITAYLVNTPANNQLAANTTQQPTEVTTRATEKNTAPVQKAVIAAIPATINAPVAKQNTTPAKAAVPTEPKKAVAEQQIFIPTSNVLPHNNEVEVLVPLVAVDQNKPSTDAYYFPAVDMYTGENRMKEEKAAAIAKIARTEKPTETTEVSSSSAPRLKFRPKKHGRYNYGKINRTHSRRR